MINTIDDLLKALQAPDKKMGELKGSPSEIWSRIGSKDPFDELGLSGSELDDFLNEWIADNPYNSI